jgi:hypothetical protein
MFRPKISVGGKPMEPRKMVVILGGKEMVGDWIVVDPEITRVLASASTPEEALRKAAVNLHEEEEAKRPIVMQVPDPSLVCLY